MFGLLVLLTVLGANNAWFYDDYDPDGWVNLDGLLSEVVDWARDDDGWVNQNQDEDSDQRLSNYHWHASHDRRFRKLSSYLIEVDRYSNKFCKHYTNCQVQVKHGASEYKIIYTLPKCDDDVTVKIKHRALYMYARSKQDSKKFFDLRILPDMLKAEEAEWLYEGDKLIVIIPIDNEAKRKAELEKKCSEINENVIDVPKVQFQYKFGK